MRVGAIDIGTNSVHLLVADVTPDGEILVVEKDRVQVQLGSGGLGARILTDDAMTRGIEALASFRLACDSLGVEDIHAAATSAVREASNGAAFCKAVKARTGIHVRMVSGVDEARLIYLGARSAVDFTMGRALLFDLGGGSTEFILCDAEQALITLSLPLGHIRLTDAFRAADPFSDAERRGMRARIQAELQPLVQRVHGDDFRSLIGTSGTVRTLARMATLARNEKPPDHDHGLLLHRRELEELIKAFQTLPSSELDRLPGMDMRRRQTLPAGAVLVREVMKALGKNTLVTSERSLRDGLLVDWALHHRPEIALSGKAPDPRRRAVLVAMERYQVDEAHAQHVASTAEALFDGTANLHGLRVDDRHLLRSAAMLHDIGHHIASKDHHKHGWYLLRNIRMYGFTAPEIALMSVLVRFHSGARPKSNNAELKSLSPDDQRRAWVLIGLLRLADALDRSHDQLIQDVKVDVSEEEVRVTAIASQRADLERWAAPRRSVLLANTLGRPVTIHIVDATDASTTMDDAG